MAERKKIWKIVFIFMRLRTGPAAFIDKHFFIILIDWVVVIEANWISYAQFTFNFDNNLCENLIFKFSLLSFSPLPILQRVSTMLFSAHCRAYPKCQPHQHRCYSTEHAHTILKTIEFRPQPVMVKKFDLASPPMQNNPKFYLQHQTLMVGGCQGNFQSPQVTNLNTAVALDRFPNPQSPSLFVSTSSTNPVCSSNEPVSIRRDLLRYCFHLAGHSDAVVRCTCSDIASLP